jgi:hypothetical protein
MEYSSFFIIKVFGLNRSSFKQWLERGLIEPSIEKASGKGTKNLFSRNDLYSIRTFLRLSALGIDQRDAGLIASIIPWDQVTESGTHCVIIRRSPTAERHEGNEVVQSRFHYVDKVDLTSSFDGLARSLADDELVLAFNVLAVKREVDAILV